MKRLLNVPLVCALSIVGLMVATPIHFSVAQSSPDSQSSSVSSALQPNAVGECVAGPNVTGQISGRIIARSNGALIENVAALAYRLDGSAVTGGNTSMYTSSGLYTITLPPGNYKLAGDPVGGNGPSARYAPAWFSNQDSFDNAAVITVISGSVQSNVDIALPLGSQIQGRVTAANTQNGLANVFVTAEVTVTRGSSQTTRQFTAITDATGAYTLTGLLPGSYIVLFSPSVSSGQAYASQYYSGKLSKATATPIVVASLGGNLTGINVALTAGASIRGRVVDEATGLPFVDPSTRLVVSALGDGIGAAALVDADGRYTLTVPSGRYKIGFQPSRSELNPSRYLYEYFDNQATLDTAQFVDITAPSVRDNINAALRQGAWITGVVTDHVTGLPIYGVDIMLNTASGGYLNFVHSDINGLFNTAYGLYPGTYQVIIDATGYAGQRLNVTVPSTEDVALAISLTPCSALSQITYLPMLYR